MTPRLCRTQRQKFPTEKWESRDDKPNWLSEIPVTTIFSEGWLFTLEKGPLPGPRHLRYCPSKRGASQGIFSPSFSWRQLLRCPSESSAPEPECCPHLTCCTPLQQPGKPLPNTPITCISQERQAQNLPVFDELLRRLFRGFPSKYSLRRLLHLEVEISWSRQYLRDVLWHPAEPGRWGNALGGQKLAASVCYLKEKHFFLLTLLRLQEKKERGRGNGRGNCIL